MGVLVFVRVQRITKASNPFGFDLLLSRNPSRDPLRLDQVAMIFVTALRHPRHFGI